ncbi:hypothetical protein N7481_000727 [Penicillium waksmanii]|uniref:uncharacterized protein n=1 Tax=Penicillium waksmanii TaxID=69791 RepID=UPI00254824FE|nr:uncharacterized protein N7481_000727 [Penicillium waksmanii]KAJ6000318.1 hypothetical protein N7481_000727 [Penicillium waksmanii]
MVKLKESLAGPGYVILNTIRALNIIVFLDIIASCVVMEVKIDMRNGFFFFQAVTHAVMALISIVLIITELPILRNYFNRNWPLFGDEAGFLGLALAMMILGVAVLGNLNTEAMSQKSLGLAFWRIVISAGILAMVMSVINILATFIFSHRKPHVSARQVRIYGAGAKDQREEYPHPPTYTPPEPARENALKRATKRFTGRFPIKISGPMMRSNDAADHAHLQPPLNNDDAASSHYSRNSEGVPFPEEAIKSIVIFFAPIVLPRLLVAYRSFNASVASRPPPRPIPQGAERALNLLFIAISSPSYLTRPKKNIFQLTKSRITTSTDVLFTRLARLRPSETLTAADELLKQSLTSISARKIYLAFGPDTITKCEFCSINSPSTYLFFYLPFQVLLPHLVHILILLIVTSKALSGSECARWRGKFTLVASLVAFCDIYIAATHDALTGGSTLDRAAKNAPVSYGYYYISTLARPFVFGVFDLGCAAIIYLSSTHRFFFKQPSSSEQLDQGVSSALKMLNGVQSKLHATSVTRNAIVRDRSLKQRDDAYWQAIAAVEDRTRSAGAGTGTGPSTVVNNIWEEPEVVQAMSRGTYWSWRRGSSTVGDECAGVCSRGDGRAGLGVCSVRCRVYNS